jgi:hypothetical protein
LLGLIIFWIDYCYILKIHGADFPEFKNDLNDFYKKVAESEIKIIDRFEGFVTGLKTDKFLLFVERDELNLKAKSEMAKTIDRLKIMVKNAELKAVKKSH